MTDQKCVRCGGPCEPIIQRNVRIYRCQDPDCTPEDAPKPLTNTIRDALTRN